MKLIEPTLKKVEGDRLKKYLGQFQQMMAGPKTGEQAEQAVIARFLRSLDNRFVMIHNLQIESLEKPFPAILIGPTGFVFINISHEKGFFSVKEDTWLKMDQTTHRFRPGHPNLIKETKEYAQKLGMILDIHGKAHPAITPVLIFANPGVNIESTNPAIRIVLMDGIENYIATYQRGEGVLRHTEVNYLSDSLEMMANPDKAIPLGEGEDYFGRDLRVPEQKERPRIPPIAIPTEMPLPPIEKKVKLTRKQWITVAILLFFTIVLLLAAIVYALSTF